MKQRCSLFSLVLFQGQRIIKYPMIPRSNFKATLFVLSNFIKLPLTLQTAFSKFYLGVINLGPLGVCYFQNIHIFKLTYKNYIFGLNRWLSGTSTCCPSTGPEPSFQYQQAYCNSYDSSSRGSTVSGVLGWLHSHVCTPAPHNTHN